MADPTLTAIQHRLEHPERFLEAILKDVCQQCVKVLHDNSYGEKLPDEWVFEVSLSGVVGKASVFHTRLEGDRETWEVVFAAHNSGSKRYMIYPVNALALSWIQNGQRLFSKGHMVGGIKPKYFAEKVEKTISDYEQTLHGKWGRWCASGALT